MSDDAIECPFCEGRGTAFDSVRQESVTCPGCNGQAMIVVPRAPVKPGGISHEVLLANGTRVVVDDGADELRLIWDRNGQPEGTNCNLNPDDLLSLMDRLAFIAYRRFGEAVAGRILVRLSYQLRGITA